MWDSDIAELRQPRQRLRGALDSPESKPKPQQGESKPEPLRPTNEKIEVSVTLPSAPRDRLEAIVGAFITLGDQAAAPMKPAIAALLKEAQQRDFDGMSSDARLINRALNYTRRALLDPSTNLPALVKPTRAGPSSEVSYVLLQDTRDAEDGRRHRVRVQDGPDQLKRRHPPTNPLPRVSSDQIELVSTDQQSEPAVATDQPSPARGR